VKPPTGNRAQQECSQHLAAGIPRPSRSPILWEPRLCLKTAVYLLEVIRAVTQGSPSMEIEDLMPFEAKAVAS